MGVDLTSLAKKTQEDLAAIWDRCGVPDEQRRQELDQLEKQVKQVYASKVAQQAEYRDRTQADINTAVQSIKDIRTQLELPATADQDTSGPLLQVLSSVKQILEVLEAQRDERAGVVGGELAKLHSLWSDLGQECEATYAEVGTDITQSRLNCIQSKQAQAQAEKDHRTETVQMRVGEIGELLRLLCYEPNKDGELDEKIWSEDIAGIGVLESTLEALLKRRDELIVEKDRRDSALKDMARSITTLWTRLDVPNPARSAFLEQHSGLSMSTLHACEKELKRLELLKQEQLGPLIGKTKAEIKRLWDEVHYSQPQRDAIKAFQSDDINDAVLNDLEAAIAEVEKEAQQLRPLLALVNKRQTLLEERVEFEESCKDPNRFKKAGRMLFEEKMRKKLTKQLPATNKRLADGIDEYETSFGKEFTLDGRRYLDVMQEFQANEQERAATSKSQAQARKNAHKKELQEKYGTLRQPTKKRPMKRTASATSKRAKTSDSAALENRTNH